MLSIIVGTSFSFAILTIFSKFKVFISGFPNVSPNKIFVFSLNAALNSSSLASGFTKVVSIP